MGRMGSDAEVMPCGLGRVGGREKGITMVSTFVVLINSPMNLLVMRKTQPWENPDLSVGWLPGVGNHLLLYSQVAGEGNNDNQKRAFPQYVWQ